MASSLLPGRVLRGAVGLFAAAFALVATGVPTSLIANPWFTRMTPITWWSQPVWIVSAALTGLLASTFVVDRRNRSVVQGATGGSFLTALAVGCPTCNKLVVMALGVSGALSYWSPLQPLLALLSIGLLVFAVVRRLRPTRSCPIDLGSTELVSPADPTLR